MHFQSGRNGLQNDLMFLSCYISKPSVSEEFRRVKTVIDLTVFSLDEDHRDMISQIQRAHGYKQVLIKIILGHKQNLHLMNLLYCFDDNRNPEYIQILSGRNSIEENRVIGYYCLMTDRRSKTNKKFMLLSAIGIFMVVDSHTWTALNIFGDFIPYNSFFMPMFVFISGYFNKVDSSTKLWDYTRKKLKTLILPYALISLLVFGIQWLMNFYKLGESVPPPSGYLAYVLEHVCTTGVSLYICEPMWFVITLFALLMIYAIIKKLLAMHWNSFVALAVFTALHLASLHVVTTLEYEEFYYFLLPLK